MQVLCRKIHVLTSAYHARVDVKLRGGERGWSWAFMLSTELWSTEDLTTASLPPTGKLPVPNHRPRASGKLVQQVRSEVQHHLGKPSQESSLVADIVCNCPGPALAPPPLDV